MLERKSFLCTGSYQLYELYSHWVLIHWFQNPTWFQVEEHWFSSRREQECVLLCLYSAHHTTQNMNVQSSFSQGLMETLRKKIQRFLWIPWGSPNPSTYFCPSNLHISIWELSSLWWTRILMHWSVDQSDYSEAKISQVRVDTFLWALEQSG